MKTQHIYKTDALKRPVNLTVNSDLLQNAKNAGINLSQTLEDAVVVKLRKTLEEEWLAENKAAIEAFNQRIDKNGVFAANKRRF